MNALHILGLENVPEDLRGGALTIGNFDGVHRGHRRIIAHARALADPIGEAVIALTFDPPPDLVLRPDDVPQRLCPHEETVALLLEAGCDAVVTAKTIPDLLRLEPQAFLETVVIGRFAPRHIVEGPNFFFGRGRSGTIATLQQAGENLGFFVHVVEPVMIELDGKPTRISSTLIRELVMEGRVEAAADLLARPFALAGTVIGGEKVGRALEYPTANLAIGEQVAPADGVYAGLAMIGGRTYPAAVSIGCKPTLGPTERVIEANLIGGSGDFYGQVMRLEFLRRLRGQVRFENLEALKRQIERDVQQTKEIAGHVQRI
jgi:riboflavin kinase/FMN adenylyltransferase